MPRSYQALIGMARWDVEHEGTARDFAKGTKFTIELDADPSDARRRRSESRPAMPGRRPEGHTGRAKGEVG